jgi:hypothetical protein
VSSSGIAREGSKFDPLITLINAKTGQPIQLPGTYEVKLYTRDSGVEWVTGTLANTKIAAVVSGVPSGPSSLKLNFPATDMVGRGGSFISAVINGTDGGNTFVCSFLVRVLSSGEALGYVSDGTVQINSGDITIQVTNVGSGIGIPPGGTTNQILAKNSNTDYDTRWINPPVGGGGGSGPTPTATSVAGTANAITATSNGFTAPSATAQYGWITPGLNSTGAVTIAYDAFGALPLKTPSGAALDADNCLVAGIPYLVRFMTEEIRIQTSGASW